MDAYAQYQTQAVATAAPAQLVAMLYQGALTAITIAEQALRDGRPDETAHRELVRAQAIVNELSFSLDREQGGEVSANLAALYDFCADRLVSANVRKDPELLPAVRDTLAGIADAWNSMLAESASTPTLVPVG